MLLDLIDLSKLRRAIVYGLVLAGLFILQDLIVSRVTLFGVRALLVPAAVTAIGLFEGGVWGGVIGLVAGYFNDMATGHVILFTVLLPAAGFLSGALGKFMLHKGFMSYMTLALLVLALAAFCQMFKYLFLLDGDAKAFHALNLGGSSAWRVLRTGLVQTLWSLVWAVPIYFPCKLIASKPMGR